MRKVIYILTLTFTIQTLAQDPQLFENTWYLHDLVIAGQSNVPPINNEIPFVPLDFTAPASFTTRMCGTVGGATILYNGTNEFSFPNGIVWTALDCVQNHPFNQIYNQLYGTFWTDYLSDPFLYEIIDDGTNSTLTVTAFNNDKAIYENTVLLSVAVNETPDISISPNPVIEKLRLSLTQGQVLEVRIYDISGKEVLTQKGNSQELNLEMLDSGLYFIKINTESGSVTKKVIKK
jgi:hypothetical protein